MTGPDGWATQTPLGQARSGQGRRPVDHGSNGHVAVGHLAGLVGVPPQAAFSASLEAVHRPAVHRKVRDVGL
jgi:hypothetical protein